ncbi:MAG: DnaB-like helicase N-terminal domain-containing protein [Oscillospiraceae bacterium]
MDELLLRQMPHSTEAEQAVLGSMLIDAACVKDVMDQLQPDDFYLRQNREIFETIYTMFVYSRPIDGLTVAGELEKAGLANDGTRAYLAQLMEVTPTSANVLEYVRLVRERPCCGRWPRGGGDHRHGAGGDRRPRRRAGGGGAEDLRHPPGPQRPEHGHHSGGAAGGHGASGGAQRAGGQDPAGSVHRLFGGGR